MTKAEKTREVKRLRDKGFSHAEIAEKLGISRSYSSTLTCDPDGIRNKARKLSYRGTCELCGGPTDGSNGPRRASKRCKRCADSNAPKFWTKKRIIEAIKEWNEIHGTPPPSTAWLRSVEGSPGQYVTGKRSETWGKCRWPPVGSVQREFGSWANAIEAAGFRKPLIGKWKRSGKRKISPKYKINQEEVLKLVQDGWSDPDIAEKLKCTHQWVGVIRRRAGIRRDGGENRGQLNRLVMEQMASTREQNSTLH